MSLDLVLTLNTLLEDTTKKNYKRTWTPRSSVFYPKKPVKPMTKISSSSSTARKMATWRATVLESQSGLRIGRSNMPRVRSERDTGRYRLLMICKLSFVDDLSVMRPRLDLCVYLNARASLYIYPYPATVPALYCWPSASHCWSLTRALYRWEILFWNEIRPKSVSDSDLFLLDTSACPCRCCH